MSLGYPVQGSIQIYSILASKKGPEAGSGDTEDADKAQAPRRI